MIFKAFLPLTLYTNSCTVLDFYRGFLICYCLWFDSAYICYLSRALFFFNALNM